MVWFSIGYTWYMVTIWKSYHSSYSTCINIPGVNAGWQQHLISLLWLWGNEKNISIEGPLLENLCIITVHLKLYCFTFQVGSQKSQLPFRSAKPPQFKFDLKKRKKGRKAPIITHFTLSVVKLWNVFKSVWLLLCICDNPIHENAEAVFLSWLWALLLMINECLCLA